jgi:tellurite resistance protein TerC
MGSLWLWIAFNVFVLVMLALDLGVFHRQARAVSLREAGVWSVVWVVMALVFNAGILHWAGSTRGLEFFTGYLLERALSIDNIFVFAVLFSYFGVEPRYQHRVLFWGILGALVMRGAMIAMGVALINRFHWVMYVFGAFLVYAGAKMMFHKPEEVQPEQNRVFRWARKAVPLTKRYEGEKFFVVREGKWLATPLFLVLLIVETTDVAFALDSIPAIFAITRDAFIIYSSNVFAILGLRAFYFLLAGVLPYFRYLSPGLSVVLGFVGVKMMLEPWVVISTVSSVAVVGGVLTAAVIGSLAAGEAAALPQRPGLMAQPEPAGAALTSLIGLLCHPDFSVRANAAGQLYDLGRALSDPVVNGWRAEPQLAALLEEPPTVGIAVWPENFEKIHARAGSPPLAVVPADQDVREFELQLGFARLDILTTRSASRTGGRGAIASFLEKFGEGIQQVEYPTRDVARATELLRGGFGLQPIYAETRAGADGTEVNFFLARRPEGRKVLIELVEAPGPRKV